MRAHLFWLIAAAALSAASCSNEEPPKATPGAPTGEASGKQAAAPKGRVEIVEAPNEDDTQGLVRRELERAKADGRTLLVYVGATWCDPCERFHKAAKAGELDEAFPGLRLLEFDHDRDRERLTKAGYRSKMIPLFVIPREDGRSSGVQMEGGLSGDGAVNSITPRLTRLLATRRAEPE